MPTLALKGHKDLVNCLKFLKILIYFFLIDRKNNK